jgi:hypothetical protein
MSDRTDAPTEGEPSGEPGTFPAPDDPENPASEPGQGAPDEDGPSDDDATGADDSGDADDADADDSPGAPTPEQADTEARMDQVTRGLDKAQRAYGRAVGKVLEDDAMGLVPCPLCADHFPGLLTPAPPSAETVQAVRPLIGLPDFSTYRPDTHARACDACGGLGKTLTGSKVPEYATIVCHECAGRGFRSALDAHQTVKAGNGAAAMPAPTHVEDIPVPAMSPESIEALERMAAAGRAALAGL